MILNKSQEFKTFLDNVAGLSYFILAGHDLPCNLALTGRVINDVFIRQYKFGRNLDRMQYLIIFISLLCLTCQEMPGTPDYRNPFDPANPATGGEPFQLSANPVNGLILLTWSPVAHSSLSGLIINRRADAETEFTRLDTVAVTDTTWEDTAISNGHSYWYFISAYHAAEESRRTNISTIRINSTPRLVIDGDAVFAASRDVELTIEAALATEMWISHFADFSDGQWEPFASPRKYQLTTGAGEKTVFVKLKYSDVSESPVSLAKITPLPMQPGFTIENGAITTPERNVWLRNSVQGRLVKMRFSESDLIQAVPWQVYQDSLRFQLSTGAQPKTVRAQFMNDFEIESEIVVQSITPAPIQIAEIRVNQGAKYSANPHVELTLAVRGAQKVKIAEDSQFAGLAWQPVQPEMKFQLSPADGRKSLYLKFLNDFEIESDLFEQQIILDQTPPSARFDVSPAAGITRETLFLLDASASHDNLASDTELELRWDWEGTGNFTPWLAEKQASQYFQTGGEKNIVLQVRDGAGWTDSISRKVTLNTRPVAQFAVNPRTGSLSTIFQFDASTAFDPDGDALLFRWDFEGDGVWETEWLLDATISHQFAETGSYPTTLQIQDTQTAVQSTQKYLLVVDPTPVDWVTGGEFLMGSPAGVGDSDEQPTHTVNLDGFWIDRFEVTNLQFAEFLSAGHPAYFHPQMKIQPVEANFFVPEAGLGQHPVVFVNYQAARAYAQWLGKTLPTEAQWEKAARGTARIYPWGNGLEMNNANFWNSGDPYETGTAPFTTPVGFYNGEISGSYVTRASLGPFGTFDQAGNVAEWCLDWYQADTYAQTVLPNPTGPTSGSNRVVRGGSWADDAYHLRSAARAYQPPHEGSPMIGFRCVKY